jgi:dCMP deaminase
MASVLGAKGFAHISLSDMIRDELRARGREVTVPAMTEVGNELRRDFGPGVLARRALGKVDFSRNWVVTSIRHPAEVTVLNERPDFVMVFVDAEQRLRFERSLSRARAGDPKSYEEFQAQEARQMSAHNGDPAAQQLALVREQADTRLANDGTYEDFKAQVVSFAQHELFRRFLPRPEWDEYFMMMAEVAATRGNCIKRKVGAVIVRDQQVVSTGYNGTPRGITNCCEGGCPRGAAMADSGTALSDCLGVHAEENAIIQAAAHGVAVKGATLYCTLCPCSYCAKSIINAGIREVVYGAGYCEADEVTTNLFLQAGVVFRKLENMKVTVQPVYRKS